MDYEELLQHGPYELPEAYEDEVIILAVMQLTGKSRKEVEAMRVRRDLEGLDWPDEIPG